MILQPLMDLCASVAAEIRTGLTKMLLKSNTGHINIEVFISLVPYY